MPAYHVETAGNVLRDMRPTLVTVTTQPLMVSTAIKVSSRVIQNSCNIIWIYQLSSSATVLQNRHLIWQQSFFRYWSFLWDWIVAEVQHTKKAHIRRGSLGKLDRPTLWQFQSRLQRHIRRHRVQFQHRSHSSCVTLYQLLRSRLHRCHPQDWW